jgi:hypothetical protein
MDIIINNKKYELIECFDHHVLIQDVECGKIFLVEYQNIYKNSEQEQVSNVISLREWKKWPVKKAK